MYISQYADGNGATTTYYKIGVRGGIRAKPERPRAGAGGARPQAELRLMVIVGAGRRSSHDDLTR